jgi:hypothetical protein
MKNPRAPKSPPEPPPVIPPRSFQGSTPLPTLRRLLVVSQPGSPLAKTGLMLSQVAPSPFLNCIKLLIGIACPLYGYRISYDTLLIHYLL